MSDKIKCQLCGEEVHSIAAHLKNVHGEDSSSPCSLADYKAKFPEAPILSDFARQRLEEKRRAEAEDASAKMAAADAAPEAPASDEEIKKVWFHEAFRLGKSVKSAFTKAGNPIPVTADARSDEWSHMVSDWNENYVINPDLCKTVLMGLETKTPIYLYGHAGVGKSSIFKQISAGTGRRLFRFQHTIDTEKAHIVGQWVVKKHVDVNGNAISVTEFELGPLPLAMMHGWIFLADEIDRCAPTVLSAYQAVLEGEPLVIDNAPRELRIIKPHPLFAFAATGNTNGSGDSTGLYQATINQDSATIERFGIVAKVDYPPAKQEIAMIAAATGLATDDAKKIRQFAEDIRDKAFPNQVSLTIGPRVAINIAKMGMMKGDFIEGVMYAYANRLPEAEREAAIGVAKRIFA